MKLFLSYLHKRIKLIAVFVMCCLVFVCVFYLWNISVAPAVYAAALCSAGGVVLMIWDFIKFRRKHIMLTQLLESVSFSIDGLPEPSDALEEDAVMIIHRLYNEKAVAAGEAASTLKDITDYCTLWAHQIKTPLAAMSLLLQSGADAGELQEQLFRTEEYVQMVLTYLKSGGGANDFVIAPCKLDNIVKSSVHKYAKLFIRKKLALDYRETGLTVVTDEKWLEFVIGQLLSNSLKYTNEGTITVRPGEDGTSLVIEDTGIGIAAEDLPRVCDRGYTGYNGRADKKSTGIGLFLCKRILDSLSHGLEISSEQGKGTKVTIRFSSLPFRYE